MCLDVRAHAHHTMPEKRKTADKVRLTTTSLSLQHAKPEIKEFMKKLRGQVTIGERTPLPRFSSPSSHWEDPGSPTSSLCAHPKPCTANRWPGVVGGSDLTKAKEQLGDDYLDIVDWAFPENGLEAFKDGELIEVQSLKKHLGEVKKPQTIDDIP